MIYMKVTKSYTKENILDYSNLHIVRIKERKKRCCLAWKDHSGKKCRPLRGTEEKNAYETCML